MKHLASAFTAFFLSASAAAAAGTSTPLPVPRIVMEELQLACFDQCDTNHQNCLTRATPQQCQLENAVCDNACFITYPTPWLPDSQPLPLPELPDDVPASEAPPPGPYIDNQGNIWF